MSEVWILLVKRNDLEKWKIYLWGLDALEVEPDFWDFYACHEN